MNDKKLDNMYVDDMQEKDEKLRKNLELYNKGELQIVEVRYESKYEKGIYEGRKYSYFADQSINKGDKVIADTCYGKQNALVVTSNVDIKKVEKFIDKLKFVKKIEKKEDTLL